jgi:uncharacterized protein
MPSEVFLDTAFALALANRNDQLHPGAERLAARLEADRTRIVTSRAVILEIGNTLGKLRYRSAGIRLLVSLEADQNVEIVPLTDELYGRAFRLYRERLDKEWGLTDCISFIIMQDRGLTEALTPDKHFEQAGYRALLHDRVES